MASTSFTAFSKLRATTLNDAFPKGILYRAKRSAAKTTITTESGVVRLDGIATVGGRSYKVTTGSMKTPSTNNEAAQVTAFLRVDTTGAAATTASTVFGEARITTLATNGAGAGVVEFTYHAPSNQTLSVLLTVTRTAGAGTISAAGPDGVGAEIQVEDLGFTITNTGVDI